jgi:hypothetical protein
MPREENSARPRIILQHPVALYILKYHLHFSPFLCKFDHVLKFTLQNHSSLPIIRTVNVSAKLAAIIRCASCRGNCCPMSRCYTLHFKSILTYLLTYGAEPFLRNCQLCSHSRTSQHFTEPEGSLPCSQEPSTGPYFKGIKHLKALFLKCHAVIILMHVQQLNTAPTNQQNVHHTQNTCIHTSFTVRTFVYHIFGGTWVECE